jgi:DNA-binding transcriptional ArsR family regulator
MNRQSENDPRIALLKELADPLRLRVVERLGRDGPATVSRLAGELDVALPHLSNNLRRLRNAGLVTVQRSGRQAVYTLVDPGLEHLLQLLDRITDRADAGDAAAAVLPSRTCYDHLAGPLGVGLYRALRARDALRDRADGKVVLGPTAPETFASLGVDVRALEPGRQRLAFECMDATERTPHLAGALADALADAVIARGWVEREPDSRAIRLTFTGSRALRAKLDLTLPPAPERN